MRIPFGLPYRRSYGDGRPRSGKIRLLPIALFVLFALYYTSANREVVPLTGRSQLVDLSREEETALGLSSYRQILSQSEVISAGREVDWIRGIGKRVAAVTDAENFSWEFNLIRSDQANAFALPGGKVAVYSGILPIAKNDSGLATILGHEIAHAIARHGAERMAHQKLAQFGQIAASMSMSEMDPGTQRGVMAALGVGTQFGILLPFSRQHESEADYMGLIYLARACFDPEEAPRVWERMAEKGGAAPLQFLSTHPNPETRMEQFREWMPQALEIKKQHCK